MTQDPPFAIQLEPVEGCSLACSFCALQTIRDNGADWKRNVHGKNSAPYRFMNVSTMQRIAHEIARLGWRSRIELAMHGEPTMHPDLDILVRTLRKALPRASIMVTTNGSGLTRSRSVDALFVAGVNTIAFDDYKHARWRKDTRAALSLVQSSTGMPMYEYPDDKRGNPHRRFHERRIVVIRDISMNTQGTHKVTNQGGNSGQHQPLEQRCAKPFRELSIRWDGNVALCCDDWRGQYKIGNVLKTPLDELWLHPRFEAARTALYHQRRDMVAPCSGCNVRTYRNGLLPDHKGLCDMPPMSSKHHELIHQAQAGRTFSIKLKRGD